MDRLRWRSAHPQDKSKIQQLLLEREEAWVSLIDRFINAGSAWQLDYSVYENRQFPEEILACFYLNEHGMAILAVSPRHTTELNELELIRLRQTRLQRLFCLMGTAEYVLRLQYALQREAIATTRYYLMHRPPPHSNDPLTFSDPGAPWPASHSDGQEWHGLLLRRAKPADSNNMFELQALYELEEVMVKGHQLNIELTRRQLELNLDHQCIWLAAAGSLMVAKAGTNARSWHYAQIGGVFTLPAWRNRKIGEQLMKAVLQDIFSAGLGGCLFVKQSNAPALQLYEKIGFISSGELIISYF